MWEKLLAATQVKSIQLSQAWQQDKYNLGVDNMIAWMNEAEVILNSTDFGSDLPTVERLIKEHTLLEQDVRTHQDVVDIIVTAAQQFTESGHFDLKNILARKVSSFNVKSFGIGNISHISSCSTIPYLLCLRCQHRKA